MTRDGYEPPWCAGDHDQIPLLHRSKAVKVGPERYRGNGQAFAWLQSGGTGPVWLGLGVAHMTNATILLSLDDAAELLDAVDVLLRRAGNDE